MKYTESSEKSKNAKEEYLNSIYELIEKREEKLTAERDEYIKEIYANPEKYRADLRKMLGYPLTETTRAKITDVKSAELADEGDYTVCRMTFTLSDGIRITGLLFQYKDGKRPMIICQHGALGSPELISGIDGNNTFNYNHMLERVLHKGVNVFAPQLLIWNTDKENHPVFDRVEIDARLKRVGSSITAIELSALMSVIDHFEAADYTTCFGMVGLSYGGFYTLLTAALDTRIKAAISCSFFNDRSKMSRPDWIWDNSAVLFGDAEMLSLVYPRYICIEVGKDDPYCRYQRAKAEEERFNRIFGKAENDAVDMIYFEGEHEFYKDDAPIIKLIEKLNH